MKQNQEYNENYEYEHDVRNIVEKTDNTRAFYNNQANIWEVEIDYGKYNFIGKISQEGIPTKGKISNDNITISFENNNKFPNNNFKDTIIGLYQDKINEMIQEDDEEIDDNNVFQHDADNLGIIPEQEGESGSEEEGNVIHEEPKQPTQQPQTQPNLNLQNSQSRRFGLGWNK